MNIVVNWPTVVMGAIVLGAAALACTTYYFLESQRIRLADRRQRREFEGSMKTVELPEYNGNTYAAPEPRFTPQPAPPPHEYDWTPESLAYLSDPYPRSAVQFEYSPFGNAAPTAPLPVVPSSPISGPLPVIDTTGTDDFMARLRAENAEFLARWETTGA